MSSNNQTIYQVFVRNYSKEGTFAALTKDLNRIKDLGADILYLMPINEIGVKQRKGTYGSPYASKDYFSISKDLGNLDDLKILIRKTHDLGMKIILDVVFHHTSPDNPLYIQHPEYYFHKDNGEPGNRVGDWSDIIDLETSREDTQEYLLQVIDYWVSVGFDGFRFDVASLIDFRLFEKIRSKYGDDILLLAETIDPIFSDYIYKIGHYRIKDNKLFPVFDVAYNYNYFHQIIKYLETKESQHLKECIRIINEENQNYPEIIRSHSLENHDVKRIASYVEKKQLLNLLTCFGLLKGFNFIYAGEEYGFIHKPDLFEKDPIDWSQKDEEIFALIKRLCEIKKEYLSNIKNQTLFLLENDVIKVELQTDKNSFIGLYNFSPKPSEIILECGLYQDLIKNQTFEIQKNQTIILENPLFLLKK